MAKREKIEIARSGYERVGFILDAAARIAAATEANSGDEGSFNIQHKERAEWAFTAADALWTEACKRFLEEED